MLLETKPKDHLHDNDDKKMFFHRDVSNGHVYLIKYCSLIKKNLEQANYSLINYIINIILPCLV